MNKLRKKHPNWNWNEVDEVSNDDLQAAADYFDELIIKTQKNYGNQNI